MALFRKAKKGSYQEFKEIADRVEGKASQRMTTILIDRVHRLVQATAEARPTAQLALANITANTAPGRQRMLGFRSVEEAKSIVLGDAVAVYYVPLDKLKTYVAGSDAKALLYGGNELLYQVMAGTEARSSVTVEKVNSVWKVTTMGRPALAKTLFSMRNENAQKPKTGTTSYFEVFVPALNLRFLGHLLESQFFLVPMKSDVTLDFRAGKA
jgi:hypothetical protein